MSEQGDLFGGLEEHQVRLSVEPPTLEEKFQKYLKDNPGIYEAVKEQALAVKRAGRTHYGIATIFEYLRHNSAVRGDDGFKLNNNYRAPMARKLMEEVPVLEGFFNTRESQVDDGS